MASVSNGSFGGLCVVCSSMNITINFMQIAVSPMRFYDSGASNYQNTGGFIGVISGTTVTCLNVTLSISHIYDGSYIRNVGMVGMI